MRVETDLKFRVNQNVSLYQFALRESQKCDGRRFLLHELIHPDLMWNIGLWYDKHARGNRITRARSGEVVISKCRKDPFTSRWTIRSLSSLRLWRGCHFLLEWAGHEIRMQRSNVCASEMFESWQAANTGAHAIEYLVRSRMRKLPKNPATRNTALSKCAVIRRRHARLVRHGWSKVQLPMRTPIRLS